MSEPKKKPEPTDDEFESAMNDFNDAFRGLLSLIRIKKRMAYKHLNPDEEMTTDEAQKTLAEIMNEIVYKRRQFYDKANKHVDLGWRPDDDDQQLQ